MNFPARRPKLWIELCAGSAAVTLRLLGGPNASAPVSYIGSKKAYARAILNCLGIRSGTGADAVILVEAGPWASIWATLIDPAGCATTARVMRSWADQDPKTLWDKLKAVRPVGTPEEAAAAWMWLNGRSFGSRGEQAGFDGGEATGTYKPDQNGIADRIAVLSGIPWPPTDVSDPIATAEILFQAKVSFGGLAIAGHCGYNYQNTIDFRDLGAATDGMHQIAWPRSATGVVRADVREILPPSPLPERAFVYMDPPYAGTIGYGADLPREDVLAVARRWAAAGAVVAVSEMVPLDLPGWHTVEITDTSESKLARTFSKSHREWLTMNVEPAFNPLVQSEMYGDRPEISRAARRKRSRSDATEIT